MENFYQIAIRTPTSEGSTVMKFPIGDRKFPYPKELTPKELLTKLNKVVIGQDNAKKKAVAAVVTHIMRGITNTSNNETSKIKNNLLLIGPTGCGKTLILQTLADVANIELIKIDATKLSPTGYVGSSIEGELAFKLEEAVQKHGKSVEYSIVFIDEIDKLANTGSVGDGEFSSRIQSTLLTIIEGTIIKVSVGNKSYIEVNTGNMLFVFAGNFQKVRETRVASKKTIGFGGIPIQTSLDPDITEELVKSGIIEELVSRMHTIAELTQLNREEYKKVLLESEASPYVQYKKYMQLLGLEEGLSESAINAIVDKAMTKKTGLRGLTALVAQEFEDLVLESDYSNIQVPAKGEGGVI
jgi:ATP-dependent Clp protease ATP-binding subunit ClpX